MKFGVGDDLSSAINIGCEDCKWGWARAIKKAIQVLAFEVGYNMCLPKEVLVPGKFDGNQVMNLSERCRRGRRGSGRGSVGIYGGRGGHCSRGV